MIHFTEWEHTINYTQFIMVKIRTLSIGVPAIAWPEALSAVAFFIPLCIPGPQLVVGSIVNMLLVLYALRVPSKQYIFICLLPGIGAIGNGLLFGTFTPFLVYLLPGIWAGNMLFIWVIHRLFRHSMSVRIGMGAMTKSLIIFIAAYVLVRLHIVPSALLIPMGAVQIATAVIGGYFAALFHTRT